MSRIDNQRRLNIAIYMSMIQWEKKADTFILWEKKVKTWKFSSIGNAEPLKSGLNFTQGRILKQ